MTTFKAVVTNLAGPVVGLKSKRLQYMVTLHREGSPVDTHSANSVPVAASGFVELIGYDAEFVARMAEGGMSLSIGEGAPVIGREFIFTEEDGRIVEAVLA